MKRLSLIGSWKRIGVQAGLLAGIGLAFVGGAEPPTVDAAPVPCQKEGNCTFKKPLFGIILDNSSSMNEQFDADTTRWEGAVDAITKAIAYDNGYIAENFILGLVRFGHDPNPQAPGTKIPADTSGLIDGQKLDVPWYDDADPAKAYIECTNGDAILAALEAVGAPSGGNKTGIGTWTKGAMDFAATYIAKAKADHPLDNNKRAAILLVLTDGKWTDPTGMMQLKPATQDPKITAGNLFTMQDIPTYVVAIGDAEGQGFANDLAAAGGTTAAIDAGNPQELIDALTAVIVKIQKDVVAPICTPGLPRIMVLLDASSSMLNINNGMTHAGPGLGGWDQARDALAGDVSLFDVVLNNNNPVENLVHLGLAVFGHNAPQEEKLIVQYGPCRKDNFAWALDPATSCEAPGCTDPYAKPKITWTFKDGSIVSPMFDDKTLSHMPRCDLSNQLPNACIGSGTYTHLGLNLVQSNIATYKAECSMMGADQPCNDETEFINILVTDGVYQSTDAQVQAPLQMMYTAGITTYVIGFGELVDTVPAKALLNKMADWGSGNIEDYYDANNQAQLEASLKMILEQLTFDECCSFNNCSQNPEPDTNEPDPMIEPGTTTGDAGTDTDVGTTTTDGTTGGTTTGATTDESTTDAITSTATTTSADTDTASTGNVDSTAGETTNTPTETAPTEGSGADESGTSVTTQTTQTTATTPATDPTATGDESASSGGQTDSETTGVDDDGGCGCTTNTDEGKTRGLLGMLLTFGLAGFMRRRRRAV